ncbi:hypothetical protein [Pyxidicoccus trucidator]|uniref:hypothetical protein n=1 Tax=Pyxidicoccus trucidator TaxID=2709662 RepID=UPI0013DC549F|nr:hypothetical protein [Pyxidicoccus trucidator]
MSLDLDARCATHPQVSATAVCHRCGRFVCDSCARPVENDVLCGDCVWRQALAPEVSSRAWVAFGLGLAGLLCGLVPGMVGWVVAESELRRIKRGEAPVGGRTFAEAARLIGKVCTAALVLMVLGWLQWLSSR